MDRHVFILTASNGSDYHHIVGVFMQEKDALKEKHRMERQYTNAPFFGTLTFTVVTRGLVEA